VGGDMESKGNKRLAVFFGLAVSVLIVGALAFSLDYDLFLTELKKTKVEWFIAFCVLHVFVYYVRALRWRYLLPDSKRYKTASLFKSIVIGTFATFVLPLRAGEFVRAWHFGRIEKISFSATFASVVTERVFDVITLLALLALTLSKNHHLPDWVSIAGWSLAVLAALIEVLMIASYFWSAKVSALVNCIVKLLFPNKIPTFIAKLLTMMHEFLLGLRALETVKELIVVLVWSFFIWGLYTMMYQCGLYAFGENPSLWVGLLVNILVALAVAAPSSPGFLGTFELGCAAALTISGYSTEFAIAYAVVLHGGSALVVFMLGGIVLWREKLGIKDLKNAS